MSLPSDKEIELLEKVVEWLVENSFTSSSECDLCGSHEYCNGCGKVDYVGHEKDCKVYVMIQEFKSYCKSKGVVLSDWVKKQPYVEDGK